MSHAPFIAVIPARLASTRLPNKPLADIDGKPMVVRVAERAHQSSAARVVVATDAVSVADACMQHHVEAVLTLSLIHISEPTRRVLISRMPSSA